MILLQVLTLIAVTLNLLGLGMLVYLGFKEMTCE